jgi:hypothetical protein
MLLGEPLGLIVLQQQVITFEVVQRGLWFLAKPGWPVGATGILPQVEPKLLMQPPKGLVAEFLAFG